jgi:hypothetical protein
MGWSMTENRIVKCRGQLYEVSSSRYWHLTHANGNMLHNARLAEGICTSISVVTRMPGLGKAVSPYAIKVMSDAKEKAWEATRLSLNSALPSRSGAVFLFDSEEQATTAIQAWFSNETRTLVDAHIVSGATIHVADARLLDCRESEWATNARRYWLGEMTAAPIREVLVDGLIYFPGWEAEPFGLMKRN